MQLKKRARRLAPTYNEKSCPTGTRRQDSDFNQTNNFQGRSSWSPSYKARIHLRSPKAGDVVYQHNHHEYKGPRIPLLPGDNGRFVVTSLLNSSAPSRSFSFDPATLNEENFPESYRAHRPTKVEPPIPIENIKRYRGTQRQYEQRGLVLNTPMRIRGRRNVYHFARMRAQQASAHIRRTGFHHPTPRQVEMYYAGAEMRKIVAQR